MKNVLNIGQYKKEDIFFTSDLHLNHQHKSILKNRNVESREENTEYVINLLNSTFDENSIVFHLGDFVFTDPSGEIFIDALKRINFKKMYLLWGNHNSGQKSVYYNQLIKFFNGNERKAQTYEVYPLEMTVKNKQVVFMCDYLELKGADNLVVLQHFALRNWHKNNKGSYHLCGHSHGDDKFIRKNSKESGRILDVGIDSIGRPISLTEVESYMHNKKLSKHHENEPNFIEKFISEIY